MLRQIGKTNVLPNGSTPSSNRGVFLFRARAQPHRHVSIVSAGHTHISFPTLDEDGTSIWIEGSSKACMNTLALDLYVVLRMYEWFEI